MKMQMKPHGDAFSIYWYERGFEDGKRFFLSWALGAFFIGGMILGAFIAHLGGTI